MAQGGQLGRGPGVHGFRAGGLRGQGSSAGSPPVLPTPSSCPPVIQISSSGLGVGGGEGKGDDVGRKGGRRRRGEEEEEWEGEELMGGGRRGCRQVQVRQAELLVHLIAGNSSTV